MAQSQCEIGCACQCNQQGCECWNRITPEQIINNSEENK